MTATYQTDRLVAIVGGGAGTAPIPVVNSPATTQDITGVNAAVPSSSLTTIVTFTNSLSTPFFFDGWLGTGQYEGDWFVVIDTVTRPEDRSSASTMRAGTQFSTPRRIDPGSIIDIKVQHYGSATGQFSATIFGHR